MSRGGTRRQGCRARWCCSGTTATSPPRLTSGCPSTTTSTSTTSRAPRCCCRSSGDSTTRSRTTRPPSSCRCCSTGTARRPTWTMVGFPLLWDFKRGPDRTTVVFPFYVRRQSADHVGTWVFPNYYHSEGLTAEGRPRRHLPSLCVPLLRFWRQTSGRLHVGGAGRTVRAPSGSAATTSCASSTSQSRPSRRRPPRPPMPFSPFRPAASPSPVAFTSPAGSRGGTLSILTS